MPQMIDGEATIEEDNIVIRFSIPGLAEYLNDEELDGDAVGISILRLRRRLREISLSALARAFVDELNCSRMQDCSLIAEMVGEAIKSLAAQDT